MLAVNAQVLPSWSRPRACAAVCRALRPTSPPTTPAHRLRVGLLLRRLAQLLRGLRRLLGLAHLQLASEARLQLGQGRQGGGAGRQAQGPCVGGQEAKADTKQWHTASASASIPAQEHEQERPKGRAYVDAYA